MGIEHAIRIGTCNHCLGRIAGVRIAGDPLDTVGERVRNQALERDPDLKVNDDVECCPFVRIFSLIWIWCQTESQTQLMALNVREYSCVHFAKDQVAAEEALRASIAATGSRPLKATLSDAIQSAVADKVPGISWVKERPELMILFDTLTLGVNVDIRALFLYGRYRKLSEASLKPVGRVAPVEDEMEAVNHAISPGNNIQIASKV